MFALLSAMIFFNIFFDARVIGERNYSCNFAPTFNLDQLLNSTEQREMFLMNVTWWEGQFLRPAIGFDSDSALTYESVTVDYVSGMPKLDSVVKASQGITESLHLASLVLALNGSKYAVNYFESALGQSGISIDSLDAYLLDQLAKKITAYEEFNRSHPGFAGFLPDFHINDSKIDVSGKRSIFSTTNAQLAWGMAAVAQVLHERGDSEELARRYENYFYYLASTILTVFYHDLGSGNAGVQSWAVVLNQTVEPTKENFIPQTGCARNGNCFAHDPWESEMAIILAHFYANWTEFGGESARSDQWVRKRAQLQSTDFNTSQGYITLERGWVYSSVEKSKYLMLPYLDVEINERVFLNGERARTQFSALHGYPGLFSSGFNYSMPSDQKAPFWRIDLGISEFSFKNSSTDMVMPAAAFPLFLHVDSQPYGVVWLAAMLRGAKMQGPLGATDGLKITGDRTSQATFTQVKLLTVVAICGGIAPFTRDFLKRTGKYDEFVAIIEDEWTRQFGDAPLKGENISFATPIASVNDTCERFSECPSLVPLPCKSTEKQRHNVLVIAIVIPIVLLLVAGIVGGLFYATIIRNKRLAKRRATMMAELQIEGYGKTEGEQWTGKGKNGRFGSDEWEFAVDDVVIFKDEKLGSGAFAVVYKGILKDKSLIALRSRLAVKLEHRETHDVAVKMPLSMASTSEKADLLDEIAFMKNLGYHEHLVNMIGCVSNPANPLIITELCALGDLLKLLHRSKTKMRNDAGEDITEVNIENNKTIILQLKDLFSISWQISDAMVYLSSHNYIHRDIAARNVLVTEELNAKIGDFGLCRTLNEGLYEAHGSKLPIKWMAIESLKSMQFSTKSDVWSFGVLLWEIFTFGDTPFPGVMPQHIAQMLLEGQRLPAPVIAGDLMNNLMMSCWNELPEERPSFEEINQQIRHIVEDPNTNYHYLLL